ncbi:MAG: hypothetical protein WC637_00010 [Victivallales bacterium]|jgi:hypothetical protein
MMAVLSSIPFLSQARRISQLRGVPFQNRDALNIQGAWLQNAGDQAIEDRALATQEKQFAESLASSKENLAAQLGESRYQTDKQIEAGKESASKGMTSNLLSTGASLVGTYLMSKGLPSLGLLGASAAPAAYSATPAIVGSGATVAAPTVAATGAETAAATGAGAGMGVSSLYAGVPALAIAAGHTLATIAKKNFAGGDAINYEPNAMRYFQEDYRRWSDMRRAEGKPVPSFNEFATKIGGPLREGYKDIDTIPRTMYGSAYERAEEGFMPFSPYNINEKLTPDEYEKRSSLLSEIGGL